MTKEYYWNKFQNILLNKIPISNSDNQLLIMDTNESWRQCLSAANTTASSFPPYWFISNKGNLISVYGRNPKWLKQYRNKNGSLSYHFVIYEDGIKYKKSIKVHNLVRLVFGNGTAYGTAEKEVNGKGLKAFGEIHGHHIDGSNQNNQTSNIQFLTSKTHRVIHSAPKQIKQKSVQKFLANFKTIATVEEPNRITVLFTGQTLDKNYNIIEDDGSRRLVAVNQLKFGSKASEQIRAVQTEIRQKELVNATVELLLKEYGIEFFKTARYLYTIDEMKRYYKCIRENGELRIEEVTDLMELVDVDFIKCSIRINRLEVYM